MKHTMKADCTHAYVGISLLLTIFMVLFVAVMPGQELPNAPQAAVIQKIPPVHKQSPLLAKLHKQSPLLAKLHKQSPLLAKPGSPDLGSADWFREREHFKLARVIPLLTHIDWNLSFGKPNEAGHGSGKSR